MVLVAAPDRSLTEYDDADLCGGNVDEVEPRLFVVELHGHELVAT